MTETNTATASATQASYDNVPYSSFPYPNTNPERLYTIAKLFGMQPVSFKDCKVLELGCAGGSNIISFASMFPTSTFVGIDFSEVQIKQGQDAVKKLGLKNVTLKAMSISEITAKFGKFDYIIAHGVLSWVPKKVQDKIFDIFSKNLTKNGVAYVSYNTLPGWSSIKGIREMMLYHTKNFEKPEDKVREARLLLNFIQEANAKNKTPYTQEIDSEIEILNQQEDVYLLHEHLEENNEPFYFYQVAEKAAENGLQYLGETSISSMFPGNFSETTAEVLATAANDAVRVEQYMDFLRNRRFRCTLFCNKDNILNRNLKPETLEDFYLVAQISENEDLENLDLTKHREAVITFNNGAVLTTTNTAVILAIKFLVNQKGKPIATKELLNKVFDTLGQSANANKEALRHIILEQFLRLVLTDAIGLHSYPGSFTTEVSSKPKASELARYQAAQKNWITNQRGEKADIDFFNRVLIQYLDGNNDFDTILEYMIKHAENDELEININGKKLTNKKQLHDVLKDLTKRNIENFGPNAVLVA